MRKSRWCSIAVAFVVLSSCSGSIPNIDGLDRSAWKNDKGGCAGRRAEMGDTLLTQKEKLLALSELDIVEVLGKPDEEELYKRNQKFYYYSINPSVKCNLSTNQAPLRLVIRFNAMGLAKEISTEQ